MLEHVQVRDDVGIDIGVRVLKRVADVRLRREMDDGADRLALQRLGERLAVGQVDALEPEVRKGGKLHQPPPLQLHAVEVVQVVDAEHALAALREPARDVIADEARRTGHENCHQSPLAHFPGGVMARIGVLREDLGGGMRPIVPDGAVRGAARSARHLQGHQGARLPRPPYRPIRGARSNTSFVMRASVSHEESERQRGCDDFDIEHSVRYIARDLERSTEIKKQPIRRD